MRLWSCTSDERYGRPISGRLVFALTPLILVDRASIAPTYATLLLSPGVPINRLFTRASRLIRIFRIFKLERYGNSLAIIKRVLIRNARELLTTVFVGSLYLS
ncbi:MAG: ion transporter [Euryarchaeota archaeon]|nr:ion transporter [Euryarchaeota archaeon]